jgi:ribosomal protein L31
MESITIKVEPALAKEIDRAMHPLYSTKTEFIREAIRDKIIQNKIKKMHIEKDLVEYRKTHPPWGTKQTTYEEERRIRENVGNEFLKKHGFSD